MPSINMLIEVDSYSCRHHIKIRGHFLWTKNENISDPHVVGIVVTVVLALSNMGHMPYQHLCSANYKDLLHRDQSIIRFIDLAMCHICYSCK